MPVDLTRRPTVIVNVSTITRQQMRHAAIETDAAKATQVEAVAREWQRLVRWQVHRLRAPAAIAPAARPRLCPGRRDARRRGRAVTARARGAHRGGARDRRARRGGPRVGASGRALASDDRHHPRRAGQAGRAGRAGSRSVTPPGRPGRIPFRHPADATRCGRAQSSHSWIAGAVAPRRLRQARWSPAPGQVVALRTPLGRRAFPPRMRGRPGCLHSRPGCAYSRSAGSSLPGWHRPAPGSGSRTPNP